MKDRATFQELGAEIGELVDVKNAAYGSSVGKCGDFMRLLYPEGIPPQKVDNALLLVRIFDKQMRIATDEDALGESPFADIAGYGLLGARMHKEKHGTWQGSVKGPDAPVSPKAQPASAEPLTKPQTTTSASAPAAPPLSQPPASSSPQPTDATAATAEENAPASAVAHAKERNAIGCCAHATALVWHRLGRFSFTLAAPPFYGLAFCCEACAKKFRKANLS